MCQSCNCSGGAVNPALILPSNTTAGNGTKYKFIGKRPIRITERVVGNETHVIFEIVESLAPTVALSVVPASIEVGQVVVATYTAAIAVGSDEIASRVLTPDAAGLDVLTNAFSFQVPNLFNNKAEPIGRHTLEVTDVQGVTASASCQIQVLHRHFILYSTNAELTAAELQAAMDAQSGIVASTIREAYGAMQEYPVPATNAGQKHYIHWLYAEGDAGIGTPVDSDGSPLPVEVSGNVLEVTNKYGAKLRYINARTSYAYGQFTFKFRF